MRSAHRRLSLILTVGAGTLAPRLASGQQYVVSGVVVDGSQTTIIAGAAVRLSGLPLQSTDAEGRFRFDRVAGGTYTLSVEAVGYRTRSLDLQIRSDTTLRIKLTPDPIALDTLDVAVDNIRVRGTVRDAATGAILLQGAQITRYPSGTRSSAISGRFTIEAVPTGQPFGILVEALEYLPMRVEFVAERDTTLDLRLEVDSVALRMIAQQVRRLEVRANSVPYSLDALGRDEIMRAGVPTVAELLRRRLPPGVIPDTPGLLERSSICVVFDDMPSSLAEVAATPPELIERIEIVGYRGRMIRVYSRRYVARLMRVRVLQPIGFMDIGLGTLCQQA